MPYQKNHEFLIDIFNEVLKTNSNAMLLLVGDGELREDMKRKILLLGIGDSVKFMGVRADIPELMQAMDLFLLPSLYEGLPLVLVEAQAAGLKCILSDRVSNEAGLTDLVKFLSLDQSAKSWAEEVIKSQDDFERSSKYKEIASIGYDIKSEVGWLEDFYQKFS